LFKSVYTRSSFLGIEVYFAFDHTVFRERQRALKNPVVSLLPDFFLFKYFYKIAILFHMKFDGIILDIDGTIWDTTEIVAGAWNEAIKNGGYNIPPVTADILKKEFGKTMDVIASDLFSSVEEKERAKLLVKCCEKEQRAIKSIEKSITYDGVLETIKYLSRLCRIYIVSNCQKGYIEIVMEKTGIEEYVSDYECFGNTGREKAENITSIVCRNNISHPVYVGDTQGDCDACRTAGVPFIWASYGFGTVGFYYAKIKSFNEIEKFI
jgi:phosphoglycolate phosphatase